MAGKIDETLLEIIHQLDSRQHDFFIHIDLKAGLIDEQRIEKVVNFSSVVFIDRMNGTWGGFSLVQIELRLLRTLDCIIKVTTQKM
ncbi:hypothetical protein [Lacticaseibacillus paracasei]|uniref:hypothetical protein n=1 Tax=Lacticaseibacillus paracasei TaxID=1597 RepID=UPI001CDC1A5E|nr:hypothetical protein [Lacticaseibacillus paracasei]